MPLYFPRNKEEEDFVLNELPDDIGTVNGVIFFSFRLQVCMCAVKLAHSEYAPLTNNSVLKY